MTIDPTELERPVSASSKVAVVLRAGLHRAAAMAIDADAIAELRGAMRQALATLEQSSVDTAQRSSIAAPTKQDLLQSTHDILARVMDGKHPSVDDLRKRTVAELCEAEQWASLEHLGASGNPVPRAPKPAWLEIPQSPAESPPKSAAGEEHALWALWKNARGEYRGKPEWLEQYRAIARRMLDIETPATGDRQGTALIGTPDDLIVYQALYDAWQMFQLDTPQERSFHEARLAYSRIRDRESSTTDRVDTMRTLRSLPEQQRGEMGSRVAGMSDEYADGYMTATEDFAVLVDETIASLPDASSTVRDHHLAWNGTEWVDERCGCRYHPDDDNDTHNGAPHVHPCERHNGVTSVPTYDEACAEIRAAGGDPNAIGKRGAALAKDLLVKRRQLLREIRESDLHASQQPAEAPPAESPAAAEEFYLLDTREVVGNCALWWCPKGAGYTTQLDQAGLYSRDDAFGRRETDVPIPRALAESLVVQHVRVEALHRLIDIRSYAKTSTPEQRRAWAAKQGNVYRPQTGDRT